MPNNSAAENDARFKKMIGAAALLMGIGSGIHGLYTGFIYTPDQADVDKERKSLIASAESNLSPDALKRNAVACINLTATASQHVGPVADRVAELLNRKPLASDASLKECYDIAAQEAVEKYQAKIKAADQLTVADMKDISLFQAIFAFAASALGTGLLLQQRLKQQTLPAISHPNPT